MRNVHLCHVIINFILYIKRYAILLLLLCHWGRRGRDRMVVRLTPTYAISAYHH